MRRGDGFTLIELLIVILIIGILAAIVMPSFLGQSDKAKDSAAQQGAVLMAKNAKAAWMSAGGEEMPSETELAEALRKGEPDYTPHEYLHGARPSTGPRDPSISRDSDDQFTVCVKSQSGRVYCQRNNPAGGLQGPSAERSQSVGSGEASARCALADTLKEPGACGSAEPAWAATPAADPDDASPTAPLADMWIHRGASGASDIYRQPADGSAPTRITSTSGEDWRADLSPDGTQIVFASNRSGSAGYDIYKANADGSNTVRLTTSGARDEGPRWSPDGTKILFESARSGAGDIYVMNADGTGQVALAAHSRADGSPLWSPDGTKIAFMSARAQSASQDVWIMNSNGTGLRQVTDDAGSELPMDWSPDSSTLLYTQVSAWKLHSIRPDGTGDRLVIDNPNFQEAGGVYSPDGTRIAFSAWANGANATDVFHAMRDGTDIVQVTNTPTLNDVVWSW